MTKTFWLFNNIYYKSNQKVIIFMILCLYKNGNCAHKNHTSYDSAQAGNQFSSKIGYK